MKDRIPTKFLGNGAIRYGIYDATGSLLRYEYIRPEDEPTEEGGAWSKSNVLPDALVTALGLTGDPQIKDALSKLSGAALRQTSYAQLSALSDGTIFELNETISGVTTPVKYIKLKNNYQSSGRVLVVRQNAIAPMAWKSAGNNAYSGSTLDNYLNTTYISCLDSTIQSSLVNVSIPYTPGNGNTTVTTLARKCFALSLTEMGLSNGTANVEGAAISCFSGDAKRIANQEYWTRTPDKGGTTYSFYITSGGGVGSTTVTTSSRYARPALTLPSTLAVLPTNSLTDMSGSKFELNGVIIGVGTYTGTGTFGSGNANTLILPSAPEFVFISGRGNGSFITFVDGICAGGYGMYPNGWRVDNSLTWYASNASQQLNESGTVYPFFYIYRG